MPEPTPVKRGDRYRRIDAPHVSIQVTRVAKDQSWADIFVYDNSTRTSWSERHKLPFPEDYVRVEDLRARGIHA